MNKKFIFSILALMTIGFTGLIAVQAYWLNKAATLKERLFRASVNRALTSVVQRLEANEAQAALSRSLHSLQFARQSMNAPPSFRKKSAVTHSPEQAAPAHAPQKSRIVPDTANVVTSPASSEQHRSAFAPPPVLPTPPVLTFQTNGQTVRLVLPDFAMEGRVRDVARDSLVHRIRSKMARKPLPALPSLSNLAAISGGQLGNQLGNQSNVSGMTELQEQPIHEQASGQPAAKRKHTLRELMEHKELAENQREWARQVRKAQEQLRRFGMNIQVGDSLFNILSAQANGNGFEFNIGGVSGGHQAIGVQSSPHTTRRTRAEQGTKTTKTSEPEPKPALAKAPKSAYTHAGISEHTVRHDTVEKIIYRADLIEKALEDMTLRRRSICDRVSLEDLEALLQRAFKENDIALAFDVAVQREQPDSLVLIKTSLQTNAQSALKAVQMLHSSEFRTRLFPNDFSSEPYHLVVRFPEYKAASLFTFSPVLGSAGACMLLIVGVFGFTLMTLMKQKKLSDMKTDFINNMTHELKTPIATIAIASEALKDGDIRANTSRVERFVGIIHDENKRLAGHVEKVLQAAQMERGELRLNTAPTDVHGLVEAAAASIALQVEQKQGCITMNLNAVQPSIEADETHLTNVIFNLLDNATKYSPECPHIHIATRNEKTGSGDSAFVLSVEDNGVGMSKDAQRHIFEKFYRVPTGNLHDVKGFGLGLSYVKTIVEAHGGSVNVRSEAGKGSCFEVRLPLVQAAPRG
jgi:two-component system phosphate regulon sensor histidine kinase PhoR